MMNGMIISIFRKVSMTAIDRMGNDRLAYSTVIATNKAKESEDLL